MKKTKLEYFHDYSYDEETMKLLNIPKIYLINNIPEVWRVAIFDRSEKLTKAQIFMVSNYGRIYDLENNKILSQYISERKRTNIDYYRSIIITKEKYSGKKMISFLVHRLVALAFIPNPEHKPFVNHIDGNPSHNYLWNLEWVTNSENILHAVKHGLKNDKKGQDRSNALWSDDEIRTICQLMEDGHKATFIYNALLELWDNDERVQYERIRALYKHIIHQTHWTHISKEFNIDFSSYNYSKETGNVNKAKKRKPKIKPLI